MKNLICLLFFISFFSFSQEEIPVIDFASGDTQSPVEESKLTGDVFYLNKKEK